MTEYANELVGRKIQIKDLNTGKLCQYKDYSIRFCKKDRKDQCEWTEQSRLPGGQCADLWRAPAARILRKYE